jgi:hypothetical protein
MQLTVQSRFGVSVGCTPSTRRLRVDRWTKSGHGMAEVSTAVTPAPNGRAHFGIVVRQAGSPADAPDATWSTRSRTEDPARSTASSSSRARGAVESFCAGVVLRTASGTTWIVRVDRQARGPRGEPTRMTTAPSAPPQARGRHGVTCVACAGSPVRVVARILRRGNRMQTPAEVLLRPSAGVGFVAGARPIAHQRRAIERELELRI